MFGVQPRVTSASQAREVLSVDELDFEVRRSARRRTLELTIDRRGELVLAAPEKLSSRLMREFVREKKTWIYTKLALKDARQAVRAEKEFVSGEGFSYLGRSHRLVLVDQQDRPIVLDHGCFVMLRSEVALGRVHFVRWYTEHARMWLQRRIDDWAPRLGVDPKGIRVLDLGHRWGSCGQSGTLNFHWKTILLPPTIVEYVVVHELVHLWEPNHTSAFWRRLEAALPEYRRRKEWLAENGAGEVSW